MPIQPSDLEDSAQNAGQPVVDEPDYEPGVLAPSIYTTSKVWKPDDLAKTGEGLVQEITDLVRNCATADLAYRRFHVLETWEQRLFDRGRQYLEGSNQGGWIVGSGGFGSDGSKNGIAMLDEAGIYATNIYSSQGDIATGALNRGKVKVSFQPRRSKDPKDVAAADAAESYKWIWEKNNPEMQSRFTALGWTESRGVTWTKTIVDRRFGLDENGQPQKAEITSSHGVLESRLPMMMDTLENCGYVHLFEEIDYGVARAQYPWMGKKIKPSWGAFSEDEFERLARISVRMGVIGRLIGVNQLRDVTMGYSWFRPGMYFSDVVSERTKQFLLENFPTGFFVIYAGGELCCCWEESMDDHLALGMFSRGYGQNRRALGTSDLPIQKRINKWADLWDAFVRTAIPITVLDTQVFNAEAIAELEASPKRFLPAQPNDGQTLQQAVGQTPAPQPIPGMAEMFQWYVGPLIQSIDGATPALFGGGEGQDNTVGATQIRLNQALERYGPAWQMTNKVIAKCNWQAAKLCGKHHDAEIQDSVPGKGDVLVSPNALSNGEFHCEAETTNSIPESGAQREAKLLSILDMAAQNTEVASIIATPSNAREIVKGLHLEDVITVDEAEAEDGALEDIDLLLSQEPKINPDYVQLQMQITELSTTAQSAKAQAAQGLQAGEFPPPEAIDAGQQLDEQLEQLNQQLQQTPQYQPSVPIREDESQDHATMAATAVSWMQTSDGRSIWRKSLQEKPGGSLEESPNWCKWTNVYLYWQKHKEVAAKFQQANAPAKVSLTGKLAPEQTAQILGVAGIQTSQQAIDGPHDVEQEARLYTPQGEIVQKTKRRL